MRWCRFFMLLFLLVLLPGAGGLAVFDEAKATRAVKFFENLKHVDGQFYDKPFKLLPWEEKIIRDVYGTVNADGTRQYKFVYIEIPKKNGKSELAAGAALYHLFADGEMFGEIYGCAADRKQASIVYKTAKRMVEIVPALAKRAKILESTKIIKDKVSGSAYEVLSAEAFTKHGFKTSACIFDELHAQPNRNLWDVMTFEAGSTRKQPIWWVITTAGDDPDRQSIGWEIHEYATKVLSGEYIDPKWYVVVYNYVGDDIYNEENWFAANPSLGAVKSLESMRDAAVTAKNKPEDERLFRWLDLNQWITTKLTTWLPLELWDATVGDWNRMDLLGLDCYMGMDLSSTTDLTALCWLYPPQGRMLDWRAIWECFIPEEGMKERIAKDHVRYDEWVRDGWIHATPGDVVDYVLVKKTILDMRKLYKVKEVDLDRSFAAMLVQELEAEQVACVDIPQTFVSLTNPMTMVEYLLRKGAKDLTPDQGEHIGSPLPEGDGGTVVAPLVPGVKGYMLSKLTHEASPVARWCFGNTSIAKNGNGQIKYVKEHKGKSVDRTKRIDLTTALVCAMARAMFYSGTIDLSEAILNEDWGM